MPYRAPKFCSYPGCTELTQERYCPLHKSAANRQYDQTRRSPDHNRTYGRRWHKIRDLYIAKHPLCELCEADGKLVPAVLVHHKIPTADGGTHVDSNLQSLCRPCHDRVTHAISRDREGRF